MVPLFIISASEQRVKSCRTASKDHKQPTEKLCTSREKVSQSTSLRRSWEGAPNSPFVDFVPNSSGGRHFLAAK